LTRLIHHVGDGIQHYEIWNEPNIPRFWLHPDPAAYTALLKAAYVAVKSINPSLGVLAGATSHADLAFIAGMYAAGAKGYFDALSIHPYTDGGVPDECSVPERSFVCGITSVAAAMQSHGDTPSIWLTELGTPAVEETSEAAQATYLTQAYRDIQGWSYVHGAVWYQLFDGPGTFETGFGLYRSDLSPRPAAEAFATVAQMPAPPRHPRGARGGANVCATRASNSTACHLASAVPAPFIPQPAVEEARFSATTRRGRAARTPE
jgi:hypothetical protein